MINKLYFNSFDEEKSFLNFKHNEPYIIIRNFIPHIGMANFNTSKPFFALGKKAINIIGISNYYLIIAVKCSKEQWFEKILPEDKYEALWIMHDYD